MGHQDQDQALLRRPRVTFRLENESRENHWSHTPIDLVFHAGSKNKIILRRNTSLFSENLMYMSQNLKNCWLDTFVVEKIWGGARFFDFGKYMIL